MKRILSRATRVIRCTAAVGQAPTRPMPRLDRDSGSSEASTSASDTALQLAKSIDDTNPAWGAAFAEAAEKAGIATPQLYAGLNVWAQGKAAEYAQMGFVEVQQNPFLTMTFQPQDVTDMAHKNGLQKPGLPQADPELVQQAQQMAQQATPAPEAALADPAADPTAEPALVGMA